MFVLLRPRFRAPSLLLVGLVLVVTGCFNPTAEERALMERRDERRLEAIAVFETIEWPANYTIINSRDYKAVFYFEETYGGGSQGRLRHDFERPEGSEAADWFRDMDKAIMATGLFEGYERRIEIIGACDGGSAARSYRNIDSGDELVVKFFESGPPGGLLVVVFRYSSQDGRPTAGNLDRLEPRPGDPCDYP